MIVGGPPFNWKRISGGDHVIVLWASNREPLLFEKIGPYIYIYLLKIGPHI